MTKLGASMGMNGGRGTMNRREVKEDILREFLDCSRQALFGLSNDGLRQSRDHLSKLVEVGRLNASEASLLENQLVQQLEQKRLVYEAQILAVVQGVVDRLKVIANDELIGLEKRLGRLESKSPRLENATKSL